MSHTPTPEERAIIVDLVSDVLRSTIERITPDLIKIAAVLRKDARVAAIGNLLSVEPMASGTLEALPAFQPRDYRKEAYIAAWAGARAAGKDNFQCDVAARTAVDHFDDAFPS